MQRINLLVLLLLACLLGAGPAPAPLQRLPTQVLIIRHAETPVEKSVESLSLKGQERAMALVPFLTQTLELISHGLPVALFATKVAPGDLSQWTLETIEPLSRYLRVPTIAHYAKEQYAELAREILTNPSYEKRTVLVCWDHEYIPRLAAALGVKPEPPPWDEKVFDRVWVITFRDDKATLVNLPQRLLFGDNPN